MRGGEVERACMHYVEKLYRDNNKPRNSFLKVIMADRAQDISQHELKRAIKKSWGEEGCRNRWITGENIEIHAYKRKRSIIKFNKLYLSQRPNSRGLENIDWCLSTQEMNC